ncbi:alpha/beta fold hydrolase [Maribacter sp. CXY002]|uniref:alpha/beta fold hydrolase n=1 Tax=Maribacter luteocoastalis TaxID=3407671 RepID=UPI003B66C764
MTTRHNAIHCISKEIVKDAPTIVFLHDSLGCVELWRDFPKRLGNQTQCNVLVYDRLGYGQSNPFLKKARTKDYLLKEAMFLKTLLKKWHIDKPILFGHSDGGSIALLFAALYPNEVSGIITEGSHVFVEEITLEGIRDAVKLYTETNLKEKLRRYHGDKTEALFWAWANTWLADDFRSWNMVDQLNNITCDALIIQGLDDEYGTLNQVNTILKHSSGEPKSFLPPHVGHTPHKEIPEEVLQKSADFILSLKRK